MGETRKAWQRWLTAVALAAELQAELDKTRLERDQQERFKWRANRRVEELEEALRKIASGDPPIETAAVALENAGPKPAGTGPEPKVEASK